MEPGPYAPKSPKSASVRPAPEASEASLFAAAPVTRLLVIANVLVFVGQVVMARSVWALMDMEPFPGVTLAFGANHAARTLSEGRFETLLTACFVHFGILHLGFNMYALVQVGPLVERIVGPGRFAPMYVAAGITGSVASAVTGWVSYAMNHESDRLSAGASGAICGVMAAAMVLGVRTQGLRSEMARSMGLWLGITVLLGYFRGYDNAAHVGGAACGALFAAAWGRNVVYSATARRIAVGASLVACLLAGGIVVARDIRDPYAALDAAARYERTVAALSAGHCIEARRALDATARLAPDAIQVGELRRAVAVHCGE